MKTGRFYIFIFLFVSLLIRGNDSTAFRHEAVPENIKCLRCHGHAVFNALSSDSSQSMAMPMCIGRRIDTANYMNSIHGNFTCTDCHSAEYEGYPHPADAKFEYIYSCLDCHEGNDKTAKFHFEDISTEYQQSIHATNIENFTCWKCHNPHEYKNVFLNTNNIKESVKAANKACFECHNNVEAYSLYTSKPMKDNAKIHEWLPNQEIHFANVRCVDCHSAMNDSIATPHNIMSAKNAVKDCKMCHSDASMLTASLYKYKMKENRQTYGFVNASIVNDAYVIGANRNRLLNITSGIIFSLVVLTILAHIMLRIIIKKPEENG